MSRDRVEGAFLLPGWPAPPRVRACTSLRTGAGFSRPPFDRFNLGARYGASGDDPATVDRNRGELAALLDLPSAPCWLRQVHGIRVVTEPGQDEPEADAATTGQPGRVLAVLSADCLPVLFASVEGDEVGAAHAGWRGLAAGVLEATVSALRTPSERLLAWLGPAAGPQAYEIGEEVRAAFVDDEPAAASAFIPTRPGHWRVDLYALARRRLLRAGVAPGRVHGGAHCTIGEPERYYSHRRDGRSGRMASLVWIEPAT
jgi:hypothetical protein